MPTKATAPLVESFTPSNENSVLDFALLIAITPTTIDATAIAKVTTMSTALRYCQQQPDASKNARLSEIAIVPGRLDHSARQHRKGGS